ncbi:MAG: hypothetical protein QOF77_809 [Solirubrobacteraceae bacterium]|jgi:hypothetical protein|nr:hypothetical protein [Solirubrobacteraceae bacterium]
MAPADPGTAPPGLRHSEGNTLALGPAVTD